MKYLILFIISLFLITCGNNAAQIEEPEEIIIEKTPRNYTVNFFDKENAHGTLSSLNTNYTFWIRGIAPDFINMEIKFTNNTLRPKLFKGETVELGDGTKLVFIGTENRKVEGRQARIFFNGKDESKIDLITTGLDTKYTIDKKEISLKVNNITENKVEVVLNGIPNTLEKDIPVEIDPFLTLTLLTISDEASGKLAGFTFTYPVK